MRATLALAFAVMLGVGCGSAASAPAAPDADETSLTISYWPSGNDLRAPREKPRQWTLRCDPAGGTHPNEADACRKLKVLKQPFKPVRRDVMCTEQYGGPQKGTVRGTYLGTRVFAGFSLVNGCQIARFKRVSFLFPGFTVGSVDS
jgi:Subtilisin inhibitor-like